MDRSSFDYYKALTQRVLQLSFVPLLFLWANPRPLPVQHTFGRVLQIDGLVHVGRNVPPVRWLARALAE